MKRKIKLRAWGKLTKDMHYLGPNENFSPDGELLTTEHKVVMQFTGLTDKNGKEIYEGDVVRWHNDRIVKIVWDDKATPHWSGLPDTSVAEWGKPHRACTVIGNKFENPELLVDQTDA